MKKKICLILAMILLIQGFSTSALAAKKDETPPNSDPKDIVEEILTEEELEAKREAERKAEWERQVNLHKNKTLKQLTTSYLIGDFKSGEILEGNNIDSLMAIASTTKILTVYVVMDEIKAGKISLDELVTIQKDTSMIGGSSYKLKEGEKVTVRELIKAAMIVSGNDAVNALAKHIAGTESNFVNKMKAKLEELGIPNYLIINSSGLPDYTINQQNMMTPRGLFTLTRSFISKYPEILEYTKMTELDVPTREFKEKNTNPILGEIVEIDGLKTGYTGKAGRCMVATGISRGDGVENSDIRLIGITMGSKSDAARYVAIKRVMEKAFESYQYRILGDMKTPVKVVENENLSPSEIEVYASDQVEILKKKDDIVNFTMDIENIDRPMNAGTVVGKITYYVNGESKHSTNLVIKKDIEEATFLRKVQLKYRDLYLSAYRLFNN